MNSADPVSTVCKKFSHFSLKQLNYIATQLKLKLDSSNILCGEHLFSTKWVNVIFSCFVAKIMITLNCCHFAFYLSFVYFASIVDNIRPSLPTTKPTKWHVHPAKTDQPRHPPSLIRAFTVHMKKIWVLSYPLSTQRIL